MAFTPEAPDFLFENWSRNDRNWYHEHKEQYKTLIQEPFIQFVRDLQPVMLGIDPLMDCSEKRISRVYRDARIVGNGPFFRDHIWCTMGRGRDLYWGFPTFFFELSSQGYRYGMGYYVPAKEAVETIRELILAEDKTFLKALRAEKKLKAFHLEGESYKRNHFPNAPEAYWNWLNRKNFCWVSDLIDDPSLYAEDLSEKVAADFKAAAPIYHFLIKAETAWREK